MWARAIWIEGDDEETEGVVPSNWIKHKTLYWPRSVNVTKYFNERREPQESWNQFRLIKVKVQGDSRSACEDYDFTSSDERGKNVSVELPVPRKKNDTAKHSSCRSSQQIEFQKQHVELPLPPKKRLNLTTTSPNVSPVRRSPRTQEMIDVVCSKQVPSKKRLDLCSSSISPVRRSPRTQKSSDVVRSKQVSHSSKHRLSLSTHSPSVSPVRRSPRTHQRIVSADKGFPVNSSPDRLSTTSSCSVSPVQTISQAVRTLRQSPKSPSVHTRKNGAAYNKTKYPLPEAEFQRKVFYALMEIKNICLRQPDSHSACDFSVVRIETMEEFEELEKELADHKPSYNNLVAQLGKIGGEDVKEVTKNVMIKLMSYSVLSHFNMKGKGNKRGIIGTKIGDAIVAGVMTSKKQASSSEVHKFMANVLKYAPDRDGGGGRKTNN